MGEAELPAGRGRARWQRRGDSGRSSTLGDPDGARGVGDLNGTRGLGVHRVRGAEEDESEESSEDGELHVDGSCWNGEEANDSREEELGR